jgi:hypothetical protein
MPKYAYFDHTEAAPQRIRGWYNTDRRAIPNLPAAADLLEVTEEQWAARMPNPSGWEHKGGTLQMSAPRKQTGTVTIKTPDKPVE